MLAILALINKKRRLKFNRLFLLDKIIEKLQSFITEIIITLGT
jgi:hypothetical protein